jgi:outer membrane lipoprotein SlyB
LPKKLLRAALKLLLLSVKPQARPGRYPDVEDWTMKARSLVLIVVASLCCVSTLQAQYNTQRGAVLGGLTGAAAGAAIGHHNGETAEGALIGSAIGVLGGALIGNSVDAEQSRQRYVEQQYLAANARAVTISEVLSMTSSGVSDGVIINHINQHGVQQRLQVADVILLHQQGVSEPVLTALQRAPIGGSPVYAASPRAYPPPVIVQDYHYVRPVYPAYGYGPRYYGHHPHHGCYPSPGVSFGISVGR